MRKPRSTSAPPKLSPLVERSLNFAKLLLNLGNSFYPFATLTHGSKAQCVCCSDHEAENGNLIEQLEWLLFEKSYQRDNSGSVLVYLAEYQGNQTCTEAVVVSLVNAQQQTSQYIYPINRSKSGITFGLPQLI